MLVSLRGGKDVDNNAYIGFDTKNHNWYLRTIINGKKKRRNISLCLKDFRWGVYHHYVLNVIRIV